MGLTHEGVVLKLSGLVTGRWAPEARDWKSQLSATAGHQTQMVQDGPERFLACVHTHLSKSFIFRPSTYLTTGETRSSLRPCAAWLGPLADLWSVNFFFFAIQSSFWLAFQFE